MKIKIKDYDITFDPLENEDRPHYSLEKQMIELYDEISQPSNATIKKLLGLIDQYPSNLQLRNYLVAAYQSSNKIGKAIDVNNEILKIQPNYLFGLVFKANYILSKKKKLINFPEILINYDFDLKRMYPNRNVFHVSEFMAIQQVAVKYFAFVERYEDALERLDWLIELNPDDEDLIEQKVAIEMTFALKNAMTRLEKDFKQQITPIQNVQRQPFVRPEFILEMTNELYENEFYLVPEFIEKYLQFDRKSIIFDLENVLKDGYSNFNKKDNLSNNASFHAFFILGELKAEESLSAIINVLEQDEEYLEAVFGDFLTDVCWQTVFLTGKNELQKLFNYLQQAGLYTYGRTVVLDAIFNIYLAYPEKQKEIIRGYDDLLYFFIDAKLEDNTIDSDFIGLLVSDIVKLKLGRFLLQIKRLFGKEYLFDSHVGNYEEVKRRLSRNSEFSVEARKIESLNEIYEQIREFKSKNLVKTKSEVSNKIKINRNDPCPCGSGKKYKKCCMGKGIYE